jgi:WD40 repeat protein
MPTHNLRLQKRLAASVLGCGKRQVWLEPLAKDAIAQANSPQGHHLKVVDNVSLLFSTSNRGELKMWHLTEGRFIGSNPTAHQGPICALDVLAVSDTQFYVLTAGAEDALVRLWSASPTGLSQLHQISTAPPPNPSMNRTPNPLSAMRVIQVKQGVQQLFVGFRNGSIQVYTLKDVTRWERLGVVDGHQRQTKVLGFDTVDTSPTAKMLCAVMENGNVNWFQLE